MDKNTLQNQADQFEFQLYEDMKKRTGGEIYLGVVGGVRTGKSTFIRRFMELLVLPNLTDEHVRNQLTDELPQAAKGTVVMTTEPKFIPKDAAEIRVGDHVDMKIRMIDCVGYMVDGASGHLEGGKERMVRTPWFDKEIPFSQAAEVGTRKVITGHSTVGIVLTTDGSFTDIPRESYAEAEAKTIGELKRSGKPFIVVLNSEYPYSSETKILATEIEKQYDTRVLPVNCEQLKLQDVHQILQELLYAFPISRLDFFLPRWVDLLAYTHPLKQSLIEKGRGLLQSLRCVRDYMELKTDSEQDDAVVKKLQKEAINLSDGVASLRIELSEDCYYENLSEMTGVSLRNEYDLIHLIKEFAGKRREYEKVADALQAVSMKGYGVVMPGLAEISMDEPHLVKHGNKYGVRMKASCPSVHMIRANIETEVAPIVGSEEQAKDLIAYIEKERMEENGIWGTNIFGKTLGELMEDGIKTKINRMDDECQMKLQDTMQKVVNDNNGGMVCIII